MINLPFTLETTLERIIAESPEWQLGVVWGEPRSGHLEGAVMYHIADVLANIDKQKLTDDERRELRLIALMHDTFKYQVDEHKPKIGMNRHGFIARQFAERYIADPALLEVIELHDEAYYSWRLGHYRGKWQVAEEHVDLLLDRLGSSLPLYVHFFFADSDTDSKNPEPISWFGQLLQRKGKVFSFS
jgi:hypothetical protein